MAENASGPGTHDGSLAPEPAETESTREDMPGTDSRDVSRLVKLAPVAVFRDDDNLGSDTTPAYTAEVERAARIGFHPGPDFLDPLADRIEEWLHGGNEPAIEKLKGLRCFFWGILVEKSPLGTMYDDDDPTPAWARARWWFEMRGPDALRVRDRFVDLTKTVDDSVQALLLQLASPPEIGRSLVVDDPVDLQSSVDRYIEDLRACSRELQQRFPPRKRTEPREGNGNGGTSPAERESMAENLFPPIPDPEDHRGPEAWKDFHPSRDFLDPMADAIQKWDRRSAITVQGDDGYSFCKWTEDAIKDVEDLVCRLETQEVTSDLARLWFDAYMSIEFRKSLESRMAEVAEKGRALYRELKGLDPKSDDWYHGCLSFGLNIVLDLVEDLRSVSVIVQQRCPLPQPGTASQDKGTGGGCATSERVAGSAPVQPAVSSDPTWEALLGTMEPADQKAYYTYAYAESKLETTTDCQAYEWLKDNGLPDETDSPELAKALAGYKPPSFATWSKQLRNARRVLGQQKHTRRAVRSSGGTIVPAAEVDSQRDED